MFKFFSCFFLMLSLVTMPVMAAFVPCVNGNLEPEKSLTVMSTAAHSNQQTLHLSMQAHAKNKIQHCHAMTHCGFHVCSPAYYSNYYRLYTIKMSPMYAHSENTSRNSFFYAPELRPPIS